MNIFSGFAILSLVVVIYFAVYSSSITSFISASALEIYEESLNIPYQKYGLPADTTDYQFNESPADTTDYQFNESPADTTDYQSNDLSNIDPLLFDYMPSTNAMQQKQEYTSDDNKFVIVMFDRGYESIFTTAKPILDKFGFKASIFITCEYVGDENGMTWNQIGELYNDGYDIQSHGLQHERLDEVKSSNDIELIVSGGKECLEERGFSPTIFQAPHNKGGDNPEIVNTISKYFDFGFTGHSELMFLNCDGWENFGYDQESYEGTTDCSPYSSDGIPTPTNKFSMKEWSHDREHDDVNKQLGGDPHGPEASYLLYKKFVEIVNSQTEFNKNGEINAIPIIGYHEVSRTDKRGTSPELFELEMEYLYENGFKVITLADLGYDENQERFYVKNLDTYSPQQPNEAEQQQTQINQEEMIQQQYESLKQFLLTGQ